MVKLNSWIGSRGAAFQRVSLAFRIHGYLPPKPDTENGTGAYAMNIARQYIADLTEQQAADIIEYGLSRTKQTLKSELKEQQGFNDKQ